jgi:hypothetical protein
MNARLRPLTVAMTLTLVGATIAPARIATAQAAPAGAGGVDDARAHYKRGVELFAEQNYSAALVEFRRAYEIAPNFSVLYNIAQIHYQLRDYAEAYRTFQSYMTEGGNKVPPPRRAEVERDMAFLKDRVGYVEVVSDAAGAEVTVDGVSAGKIPLKDPIIVSAGRRRIELLRSDRVLSTRLMEVAAGDHLKLELNEPAAAQAPVAVTPGGTVPQPTAGAAAPQLGGEASTVLAPPPSRGALPAVMWTTTGVLAAGTVVVGVLALGASSDLSTKRTTDGTTRDALNSAQSKAKTLALVTDILGGATAIAAATAIYVTFSSPSRSTTGSNVKLRVGASSVALTGTF